MGLEIKTGGDKPVSRDPVSIGVHLARLVQVIDLGIQEEEWQGVTKNQHKVMFTYEIPEETVLVKGEQKPKFISQRLTVSTFKKAAMPTVIQALRPGTKLESGIKLESLLGSGVQLNVGRTSGGAAKILNVMPLAKGQTVPITNTELLSFDLSDPDVEVFKRLPQFLRNIITSGAGSPMGDVVVATKVTTKGPMPF